MKQNAFNIVKALAILLCFIYAITNPYQTAYHCRDALKMCAVTVVPSLFIYIVFSQYFQTIIDCIFNGFKSRINIEMLSTVTLGMIAGVIPACSSMILLYNERKITKEICEDLLMLFNGCSASFIISLCGLVLDSFKLAIILYICNIIATVFSFIILHDCKIINFIKRNNIPSENYKTNYTVLTAKAVGNSASLCINMCSYIIFFKVISGYICDYFYKNIIANKYLLVLTQGLFEVTSGVNNSTVISGNEKVVIVAFLTAFSGVCIFFQVAHLCNNTGISIKKFIFSKMLAATISALLAVLCLLLIPTEVSCAVNVCILPEEYETKNCIYLITSVLICNIITLSLAKHIFIDKNHKKN